MAVTDDGNGSPCGATDCASPGIPRKVRPLTNLPRNTVAVFHRMIHDVVAGRGSEVSVPTTLPGSAPDQLLTRSPVASSITSTFSWARYVSPEYSFEMFACRNTRTFARMSVASEVDPPIVDGR